MNTTTITTNSTKKFNQILTFLHTEKVSILPSPSTLSITLIANTSQTNRLLSRLTHLLHLTPLQPYHALAA